jgi:hypothetical protein
VNTILLATSLLVAPEKSAAAPKGSGEENSKRYVCLSRFTDPKGLAPLLDDLPDDARKIYEVAKRHMTPPDGTPPPGVGTPGLADVLQRLKDRAPHNLRDARPVENRVAGDSVAQSYVLVGMLRYRLIPARVRVGCLEDCRAGVTSPGGRRACEFWDAKGKRWQLLGADVTSGKPCGHAAAAPSTRPVRFELAAGAWKRLRAGDWKEEATGAEAVAFHLRRLLLQDFASLLNHDPAGSDDPSEETTYRALSARELRELDRLAEALSRGATVDELVALYGKCPTLRTGSAESDPYSYVFK